MRLHIQLLVLFAGLICCRESIAVTIPADAKVGLVLSGGGARGLAHVGVIRVLEAHGIRPVVVTGTSMGSIVGALYASGRNAEDIDYIARNMDWREALSDASPRSHQPYQFRQLEAAMTTELRMSITRKGIAFPRGVIEGQHLEQVLGDLFAWDGEPLQFDQLPIRFAAVAADLETGQAVILDKGDVAQAVRASMSIPGALAPVQWGEHLLVDGGIVNNMPVDLARKMGADFIIAVDVSSPLAKRDELTSVFSVAGQMTTLLVHANSSQQRALLNPNDWLIVPDLQTFGSADFDEADGIIRAGVQAAQAGFKQATDLPDVATTGTTTTNNILTEPVIDFIRVKNNSPVGDDVIRALIRQQEGHPLDRARLEDDLSRLYGLDYFSMVRYRVVREEGQTGLEIDSIARETGTNWLKLGIELADDFRGNSDFNLAASLRASGLNRYGGTAFTRLQLGSRPEFELRFLQPLDPALRYFVEPALGYTAAPLYIYSDEQDEPFSRYNKADSWAGLSVGRQLWEEVAEARVGVIRAVGELDFRSGLDVLDAGNGTHYDDGYYFVRLGWDSLDDLGFPREGLRTSLTYEAHEESLAAEENFGRHLGDFSLAVSHGANTLVMEADFAISDSDDSSFVDIPFIGGFLELSGLPPRSRFGRHRALTRMVFYRQLDKNGPLPIGLPIYLGGSLEKGNVWFDKDDISWDNAIGAASLFLGVRTPLGPAYLSVGATDEGDQSLSLFLGQRFR